jgi:hypothetical protein
MKILLISPVLFLISIVPQCSPFSGNPPYPADEVPPELVRLDDFPSETVCGQFHITGNIADEAQLDIDPSGISRIWITLDGVEIKEWEPGADCPQAVEFTFSAIELHSTGLFQLWAEDCEENSNILQQVNIDATYDDNEPIVTFAYPTEGDTILGSAFIFEALVESDNPELSVVLEIDGMTIGSDDTAPFKWLVEDLANIDHWAHVIAEDSCGYQGEAEVLFYVQIEDQ